MDNNKYFGVVRQFVAKDVYHDTISPPSDFQISANGFTTTMVDMDQGSVDSNTNLIVTDVGLFCNFADGFVRKTPCERVYVQFNIKAFAEDSALTGLITIAACDKTVTGAGTSFDTELADNDYFAQGRYVYKVDGNPGAANSMEMHWWPVRNAAGVAAVKLTEVGSLAVFVDPIEITELNCMVPVNNYALPSLFSSVAANRLVLEATVVNPSTLTYLTKSVCTDFADDTAFFDVVANVLYTNRDTTP